jgi:hypothetical protein
LRQREAIRNRLDPWTTAGELNIGQIASRPALLGLLLLWQKQLSCAWLAMHLVLQSSLFLDNILPTINGALLFDKLLHELLEGFTCSSTAPFIFIHSPFRSPSFPPSSSCLST